MEGDSTTRSILEISLDVLKERFGVEFPDYKIDEFLSRVRIACIESGVESAENLLSELAEGKLGEKEFGHLVDQVINNESYFFRHEEQLSVLCDMILPEIDRGIADDSMIKIWHAGCARGEEPYSMAIMIDNRPGGRLRHGVEILATDVNEKCLTTARERIYSQWSVRYMAPEYLTRYFIKQDKQYRLVGDFGSKVSFIKHNIADASRSSPCGSGRAVNIILCRNVLMYMSKSHVVSALQLFWDSLEPGGYLILSPSEFLQDIPHNFKRLSLPDATIYYKQGCNDTPITISQSRKSDVRINRYVREEMPILDYSIDVQLMEPISSEEMTLITSMPVENAHPPVGCSVAKQFPKDDLESVFQKIQLAFEEGDSDTVDITCSWLKENYPDRIEGYYYSALLSLHFGNEDEAIRWLRQALYLDPEFIAGHLQLANVFHLTGKHSEYTVTIKNLKRLLSTMEPGCDVPLSDGKKAGDLMLMIGELEGESE